MSEELKPCPFCGSKLTIAKSDNCYLVGCESCNYDLFTGGEGIGWWKDRNKAIANADHRPIEDTQAARIAELEAERDRLREALREIIGQQPDVCFTRGCCRKCNSMAGIARKALKGAGK